MDFAHQAGGVQALLVFHLLLILWDYLTIQILEPFSRLLSVDMVVIILNRYNIPIHIIIVLIFQHSDAFRLLTQASIHFKKPIESDLPG